MGFRSCSTREPNLKVETTISPYNPALALFPPQVSFCAVATG